MDVGVPGGPSGFLGLSLEVERFFGGQECPPSCGGHEKTRSLGPGLVIYLFNFDLAATYSHGSYTTTTIGNAAFYGRVRDGIG